jgi:hypothetical protein
MADSEWTLDDEARLMSLYQLHADNAFDECPWEEDEVDSEVAIDALQDRVRESVLQMQQRGDDWALRINRRWSEETVEAFIAGVGLDPQGPATDEQIESLIRLTKHKFDAPSPLDRAAPGHSDDFSRP